jgi:hypothetical protein
VSGTPEAGRTRGWTAWDALHVAIIAWFAGQMGYVAWQVFVVLNPFGVGPLGARSVELPHELMVTRRLYAIEGWIAFVGFALYVAVTEIVPRRASALNDR